MPAWSRLQRPPRLLSCSRQYSLRRKRTCARAHTNTVPTARRLRRLRGRVEHGGADRPAAGGARRRVETQSA
eukprot:6196856-Pleurochrysis_carterae.AAC.2